MLDMAFQPYHFFICTDLVREDHNLSRNPSFVNLGVPKKLLHFRFQLLPVFSNDLRRSLFNPGNNFQHSIQFANDILFQVLTFCSLGLYKLFACAFHCFFKTTPQFFLIHRLFFHRKDFRAACKCGYPHIIVKPKLFFHLLKACHIFFCQLLVIFQSHLAFCHIFIPDENINLSSLHILLEQVADRGLKEVKLLWHTDIHIQVTVINPLHFYGKFAVCFGDLTPSKACHTFYHLIFPLLTDLLRAVLLSIIIVHLHLLVNRVTGHFHLSMHASLCYNEPIEKRMCPGIFPDKYEVNF